MNKEFLVEPDRFISTISQRLTRTEFENLQKGQFLVHDERADMGIAIFRTNENLSGKLLFQWSDPLITGQSHLVIEQVITFSRVEDGFGPKRTGPFRVKPGFGLDLDTGRYDTRNGQVPGSEQNGITVDVRHSTDTESGEAVFEAVNGATIHFPVETMCHQTTQ